MQEQGACTKAPLCKGSWHRRWLRDCVPMNFGFYNPSVLLRNPPPFAQGRLFCLPDGKTPQFAGPLPLHKGGSFRYLTDKQRGKSASLHLSFLSVGDIFYWISKVSLRRYTFPHSLFPKRKKGVLFFRKAIDKRKHLLYNKKKYINIFRFANDWTVRFWETRSMTKPQIWQPMVYKCNKIHFGGWKNERISWCGV